MEVLNHMDAAGDQGTLGPIMLGVLEPVIGTVDEQAAKLTSGTDSLKKGARDTFGKGTMGDLAEGAAGLLSSGVHAVVDPGAKGLKEGFKSLITTVANSIGKGGVSLAKLAVWYQKAEGAYQRACRQAERTGAKVERSDFVETAELEIGALNEDVARQVEAAERAFKKEVKKLGSALYNKGVQLVLGKIVQARKETKVKDTNVDAKFRSWAAELSKFMHDKLIEVGGGEGKTLAAQVPASQPDENIPKLIVYAEEAFPDTLRRLVSDAEAKVILKQTGDQAHHIEQMKNVPEWARAGASHSQIAKDHSTSPFFGVAFAVANLADNTLTGLMKQVWGGGPAPGLEGNFGEKEKVKDPKTGQLIEKQKLGPDGRPVLKDDEGLSEWQKEARKKFLENRGQGEETVKTGVAPEEKLGPALVGIADGFDKVIEAYPVLGPIFDKTIDLIRKDPENAALVHVLEEAEKRFDDYANTGQLDDAVMEEVDVLIGRAKALILHDAEEKAEHAGGEGDIHTKQQIALIDKYRGVDPTTKKARGVQVDHLNTAVTANQKAAIDVKTESIHEPKARFKAEVDRIFAHPYDSNWWVPTVQQWAEKNQHVLADYIKDRNAGKSEVH